MSFTVFCIVLLAVGFVFIVGAFLFDDPVDYTTYDDFNDNEKELHKKHIERMNP